MELVELDRFELTGRLGSGADYEVRSAVDRETGQQVVIKRPVPQMISRGMYGAVEVRTERTIRLHEEFANEIPQVCPMLGYTEPARHSAYFGDDLEQEYRVTVSQRAAGIPLVGDPMARILRVPIGLGQNLFCLHPLHGFDSEDPFPVQRQLLDAQERLNQAGYVLLDMGPQNIFFQPQSGAISIIDPGNLLIVGEEASPPGRGPQDIHDFYLEALKFYTDYQLPPLDPSGYREPFNLRPVVNFGQELEEMARGLAAEPSTAGEVAEAGLAMFERVKNRAYADFAVFRDDLQQYLYAISRRDLAMPNLAEAREAWKQALQLLREDYWQRFEFQAEVELARYCNV